MLLTLCPQNHTSTNAIRQTSAICQAQFNTARISCFSLRFRRLCPGILSLRVNFPENNFRRLVDFLYRCRFAANFPSSLSPERTDMLEKGTKYTLCTCPLRKSYFTNSLTLAFLPIRPLK